MIATLAAVLETKIRCHRKSDPGLYRSGRIFLLFRLSLWMATHLRMRSATPPVYLDREKGVLNMIEQNECQENCGCKSYSSGDFKQQESSAYNYNVFAVNCEQDWKVSGHCFFFLFFFF